MIATYLQNIKKFFEEQVCQNISLKRPNRNNASEFELVHPVVSLGWPAVKLSSDVANSCIPGIVIGLSGPVTDDGDCRSFPIELGLIVYSTGTIGTDGTLTVDDTGYIDLLNFIDATVRAIRNADVVGSGLVLEDPAINAQPENERYLDFWLGGIAFTLTASPAPRSAQADLN